MQPARTNIVLRRIVIEEFDISSQRGASKQPFKEIMAEQCILWYAGGHCCFKIVDIVKALARVDALGK